jgi:hypothetical protein
MSSRASRMCAISFDHVDVDLRVLVHDDDFEAAALEAHVLRAADIEPRERDEVLASLLVVERAQNPVRVFPHGQLRHRALHEGKEGRDGLPHRGLGRDEESRKVDRAARVVFRLNAVSRRHRGREFGASVILELRQHHDHDGDGAKNHDERHSPLALTTAESTTSGVRKGHHWRGIPNDSGCWMGRKNFVVYETAGPLATPFNLRVTETASGRRLGCPAACVESHVSTH